MKHSTGLDGRTLKVDGGASRNDLLMQIQADVLGMRVERPACIETTAKGVALLCGLTLGIYTSIEEIGKNIKAEKTFEPTTSDAWRTEHTKRWTRAITRARAWLAEN